MRILLVGASGFIGRHLHAALRAAGHQVLATARHPDPAADGDWLALDLAELARDPRSFAWPDGIELAINAAGLLSTDRALLHEVQQLGACALFELAAARGARVLQISALGAEDAPDTEFLASKAAAERHLLDLGIPAVVLRPSLVLGPGATSSRWLQRLSPWPWTPLLDNRARLQPLHVDDLCGAVLALLAHWPAQPCSLALVGPEALTMGQLLDRLRAAQGWGPGRYWTLPRPLAALGARLGELGGWCALNRQTLHLARRDNLAAAEPLAEACGYRCLPLAARLQDWPQATHSLGLVLQPLLLALLALVWLGTALACLGPGFGWGLRILGEAGIDGWPARIAVVGGALLDAALGIGLLWRRWRRRALQAQIAVMLGYTALITWLLPHYWFDPFQGVGKNLALLAVSLWLLWLPGERGRSEP
ncbi:SDR family oxidoreductase [Pseudomonas sp. GCM10022188]|uniref:SDR family oxidoreductase n=1 Tax=Pseudomonas TaxID=286 RepID=UPI001E5D9795|nr:SDR family oxidoreductase [Pseudomonas oryzagri]MCC6074463.1 SDR family oxidoreductase [Pseudomonas oryzagri]